MPDAPRPGSTAALRFRADRKVVRQEAFVAQFLPVAPLDTRPRPVPELPASSAAPGPLAAAGTALVAADLRSARARQGSAAVTAPDGPQADPEGPRAAETPASQGARPPVAEPTPAADPAVLERRLAAARDKGRDEGRAELAEQLAGERAALAKAAQALAKALARLQQPSAEQVAVLSQAVDAAVIRLASERAGCAIERAPAGFAQRVSRLAERLAGHAGAVTVRLHPADLAAIRPFLGEAMPHDLASLAAARLVADPALQRGDADVASADVRLADLLDPTIPGDIA